MFRSTVLGFWGMFSLFGAGYLSGQTINSWTNPTSGAWEDMHWSLGQLPDQGQSVFISNPGWKTVGIGATTVQDFSESLNPTSITISSPTNSHNELLLNNAGFQTSLSVQQLVINSNAALTTLSSLLTVNGNPGAVSVGGAVNQGDFSIVSAIRLQAGDIGPGIYNLTNGTLAVSDTLLVGGLPSQFNQFGGTNYPNHVQLLQGGEYNISDGNLTTTDISYPLGNSYIAGTFNQHGGTVKPNALYVNMGGYVLAGGILSCPDVEVPGTLSSRDYVGGGTFLQSGGTNLTTALNIGNYWPPLSGFSSPGDYTLSNGVLVTSTTVLGPWGSFEQSGGRHSTDSLELNGDQTGPTWADYGEYTLTGGMLATRNTYLGLGDFLQSGGTNQVTGDLTVSWRSWFNSTFTLSGGLLQTSNTMVTNTSYTGGGFTQSGGTQIVSNLLTVSRANPGQSAYLDSYNVDFLLTGGQLVASNIQVDSGATFHHQGGALISSGMLTLANGNWEANTNKQILGKLLLGMAPAPNSCITFPNGSSSLSFANSSSITWAGQAVLTIEHWNGSLGGGGLHQLFFGGDSRGLTAQQLAHIRFHNPAGASGTYPASILPTGEVVPTQVLVSKRIGNSLTLSWTSGMTLQTSTNAAGPFQDVTAPATTSYTVTFAEPQRFFRLRNGAKAQAVASSF
jgi:hypothetical protein